ncbi:retrotransposon protein, putative, ty1-copia subclass [Tanacetum coccineum]
MAQPDNKNTLSSAFKTFFELEKLTGDNFNDWYRSLRIVLRVAGTYDYLFKPCPEEPPEDAAENVKAAWKAEYKIHSDVACLMLGRMSPALQRQFELYFPQAMLDELRRMFEKPKAVEIYDLVDTLHSCKQAPGKSVSAHVLEMKGYMDQLQALGKPYDNDMAINLIKGPLMVLVILLETLICIAWGRQVERKLSYGEQYLHVGNGAQAAVEAIGVFNLVLPSGLVLSLNNCHYAPFIIRGVVSFSRLLDLGFVHTVTSNGIYVSSNGIFYFSAISVNGVFEIDMNDNVSKLAHIGKTRMQKLQREGILESINDESYNKCESCISGKMTKKPFNNNIERATDLLGLIHTDVCGPLRHVSRKESRFVILNMVPRMTVDETHMNYGLGKAPGILIPKEIWVILLFFTEKQSNCSLRYGDFLERDLISQEFSGRDYDLKDDHMDTLPSENISEIPVEPKSLGPPPELIPVRRSERTSRAPNRLYLNMEVEDDVVGDPWKLPIIKKKTDMDGQVHTYKARLVAKGHTQTYGIDYEETFSPVADIRAGGFSDSHSYNSDLGEAAYILGIKIYRDRSKRLIGLSQSAYIDKILKKFNMHNSKKGYLPMEVKHELSNEMCASTPEEVAYMKKVPYASAVGSIMYAVRCTRPDVAFAQNLVSRYQQNPGKLHWVAVKHILKYLRNTRDMFLVYGGKPDAELNVTGFCDASWQCDKDDTKSQTGYVFVVNGGAVDWKSKKQTTIAMSAAQAEYMAASKAAMDAVWIRKFVGDLGVMPSIKEPINMYCNNSAAIIFAKDSGIMKGARHFLRRYHFVQEQVESGEIKILKVHTNDNLADPFTKALPRGKVTDHANGIGLQLASSFMHTCD